MNDIYSTYKSMIQRCYSGHYKSYEDCEVCDEWLGDYNSFKEWFLDNLYSCRGETLQLDKDLFSEGKKIYSPETCCLLPQRINVSLSYKRNKVSPYPSGITVDSTGKFRATIHKKGGYLSKSFYNLDDAVKFYKDTKERYIKELAMMYMQYLPDRIFKALMNYQVK